MNKPLFEGTEWTFKDIERIWYAIDELATTKYDLKYNDPQIEVISSEQMLDGYSSHAMPIMYKHWSFGKSYAKNKHLYKKGRMGLAYEVVINTNPLITYLAEDNSVTMQALVLAHSICGHGNFFKENYLFKQWTDADSTVFPKVSSHR